MNNNKQVYSGKKIKLAALLILSIWIWGCGNSATGNEEENSSSSNEVSSSSNGTYSSSTETMSDNGRIFIVQSDFVSGYLEILNMSDTTMEADGLSIYSDAGVVSYDGSVYILERKGADNVLKIDPAKSGVSSVVYQESLTDNSNPQDMVFSSTTKAYISNEAIAEITIFDPDAGEISGSIDISAYIHNPDSNSSPYAGDMELVDNSLYVLLQRRDGYAPGLASLILEIDTDSDAVVDTFATNFKNGFGMAYYDGALYVSNPGNAFVSGDGGVEKVDLSTGDVTTIVTEDDLAGNPNHIIHKSGSVFYVTNYVGWQDVQVVELDVSDGSTTIVPGVTDAFGSIVYDKDYHRLYVGERDSVGMGIRIFEDNTEITDPVKSANSLPPKSMVIIHK